MLQSNAGEVGAQVVAKLAMVPAAFDVAERTILDAWGVQALAWLKDAYYAKAHHGTDVWGITWPDIQPETVLKRLRRLQRYQRAGKKGKANQRQRALGQYDIGIDTGRQVGALQTRNSPGVVFDVEPHSVTVGVDVVDPLSAVHYSGYFDVDRQIAPDELTPGQVGELESLAAKVLDGMLSGIFGG